MHIGLHVKYPLFLSGFFRENFEKYSNIKFHENPSNASRVVPCERTDRRTGVTKIIVAFRYFANALKNAENS